MNAARRDALIAINEALACLDYDATGAHEADELVEEATDALMMAREVLGASAWPERALGSEEERRAWLATRATQQAADGRL